MAELDALRAALDGHTVVTSARTAAQARAEFDAAFAKVKRAGLSERDVAEQLYGCRRERLSRPGGFPWR